MTTPQSFRYVVNIAMLLPEICNVFFCTFLYLKALFFFPQPFHFYISVWCTGNAQRYALSLCLPLSFWHFPTTFISWQRIIHTFPTIEKPPYFSPMHNSVGGRICPPPLPPNVLHRNLRLFEKRNSIILEAHCTHGKKNLCKIEEALQPKCYATTNIWF